MFLNKNLLMSGMWKTLLLVWILSDNQIAFAKEESQCGEYEIKGIVRKVDGKSVLKVYENSLNETVLSLSKDLESLSEMYMDTPVTVKAFLLAPIEGFKGRIESLRKKEKTEKEDFSDRYKRDDMKARVSDPLHPDLDSGLKLLKERPCGLKSETTKRTH